MCTSFVSYYGSPIYGMNFDFPDVEMRLKIVKSEAIKYICFYLKYGESYYPITGMNQKGDFANFQNMYVLDNEAPEVSKVKVNTLDLFLNFLQEKINLDQVESIENDTMLLYPEELPLHNMFADINGKAIILEYIKGEAVQKKIIGKKIVMTNFSNFKYSDNKNINPECIGVDRYLTAYNMVEEEKDLLDIDKAVNILRSTFQTEGDYQTRGSFIFNPLKSEIYMIINRNTNNIWKISLENETLENMSNHTMVKINSEGIIVNKLV